MFGLLWEIASHRMLMHLFLGLAVEMILLALVKSLRISFFYYEIFLGGVGLDEILYTSKNEPLTDIVYNSLHESYTVYMIRMYFV